MNNQSKIEQGLIQELASLRQRISELEQPENDGYLTAVICKK